VQFPFTLPAVEEKTEEELARIAEKRKEQGKKLQEMAAEKRREKVRPFFCRLWMKLTGWLTWVHLFSLFTIASSYRRKMT
jgi:hypothetical protein